MDFVLTDFLKAQKSGFITLANNRSLAMLKADATALNLLAILNKDINSLLREEDVNNILNSREKQFFSLVPKNSSVEDSLVLTVYERTDDELFCALTLSTKDSGHNSRHIVRSDLLEKLVAGLYENLSYTCESISVYLGAYSAFYTHIDFNLCCVTGSYNLAEDLRDMMPSAKSLLFSIRTEAQWLASPKPALFDLNEYEIDNKYISWIKREKQSWLLIVPVLRDREIAGALHVFFDDKPNLSIRDMHFISDLAIFLGFEENNLARIDRLKENEDLYTHAIDMLPAIVFEIDSDTKRITYMNRSGLRNFSLNKKDLEKGKAVFDLFGRSSELEISSYIRKIKSGEKLNAAEFDYNHPELGKQAFLIEASLVYRQGSNSGIRFILTDISEILKAEEVLKKAKDLAEKSSRSKSEFLANMSHEIKTPMNGVIGVLSLLEGTTMDNEQREYLMMIKKSAEELMVILNDILDYSTLEAGRMEVEKKEFSVNSIFNQLTANFMDEFSNKGLEFIIEDPGSIAELKVIGDDDKIYQILYQYVSNALKFTSEGEITLKAEKKNISAEEFELYFSVADTGIGISREKQTVIFDRFTQADSSMTRTYRGIGLGLAICKKIADLLDAEIGVESEEDEGSVFWLKIKLPLEKIEKGGGLEGEAEEELCASHPGDCFNASDAWNRSGGDLDLLKELMEVFFNDTPDQLESIKEAVKNRDFRMIEMKSHALKGSSAIVGATDLSDAALEMEITSRSCKEGDYYAGEELLVKQFENIKVEFIRFSSFIQNVTLEELYF